MIETLSHNISFIESIIAFRRKRNLKQCQKEVIYEYILAFAWWWSIFGEMVSVVDLFWLVLGGGGYILPGGGWRWVVVDIFWLLVGDGGWWHSLV